MGLKELASVVGLVLFVLFIGKMLGVFDAKKPSGGIPVPDGGVVVPPAVKRPVPSFLGFLFLKDLYGEGERITVGAGPGFHGSGVDCNAQSHGIVDNGSGPYEVMLRVFRSPDRAEVPVYGYDGGPRCEGKWMPSGTFFDVYALGERPYDVVGSLVNCGVFVPLDAKDTKSVKAGCGPTPTPTPAPIPAGTIGMAFHLTIRNADGVEGPTWGQTVQVSPSTCKKTK